MLPTHKNLAAYLCVLLFLLNTTAAVGSQVESPPATIGIAGDVSGDPLPRLTEKRFGIQVAASKNVNAVERELSQIVEKGHDAFYRYEDAGDKEMWYRIFIGSYPTKPEALAYAEQLKQRSDVDSYVIRELATERVAPCADDRRRLNPIEENLKTEAKRLPDRPPELRRVPEAPNNLQAQTFAYGLPAQAKAGSVLDNENDHDPEAGIEPVRLSLHDAIVYSLQGNREINVVAYTPKQALEEAENARSVYDPSLFADATFRRDPNLDSSVTDIVTEDEGITQAGIRQPLKTGGSLSAYLETRYSKLNNAVFERRYKNIVAPTIELRQPLLNNFGSKKEQAAINISSYQVNISQEEFRRKVIEVTNRVANVYWKLFLFRELMAIDQQNLTMAMEVYRREDVRLARGISQQLDVARAQSNVQTRRSTLLRSREEYRVAMDRLKLLLNWSRLTIDSNLKVVPVDAPQVQPETIDEIEAIETALNNRPEILKAKQELMIRQADEALSAHQRLPRFDAFGRYSLSGYGENLNQAGKDISLNDEDAWEVGIYFEWAIGNRSVNSIYRKKKLQRLQANAQVESLEDDIKLEVKQVLHAIVTAQGEIEATRLAMAAAEKVVEGEFARFDIGQAGNLELLRAQDLLAITSRSFSRAVIDYNIAMHELSRVQGVLPDGVALEMARR